MLIASHNIILNKVFYSPSHVVLPEFFLLPLLLCFIQTYLHHFCIKIFPDFFLALSPLLQAPLQFLKVGAGNNNTYIYHLFGQEVSNMGINDKILFSRFLLNKFL